jgi:crotonobetainyl-CoA:carnitine CoA-transferase CaiB-like acyl-CoA transferase
MSGPLEHVKILDLGHYISGPFCAKLLGDMGADVIKVERPGTGDDARGEGRSFSPAGEAPTSALFMYLNTNKRGITLDLGTDEGRQAVRGLAAWADIVVEDGKPGALSGLGIGHDDLLHVNPRLVMTSITPFGQTGPYRDFEATEMTAQALAGLMYFNGQVDRAPLRMPRHQAHMVGGLNAAGVTLTALFYARGTGEGQHIDVSMQESVATFYYSNLALYGYTGMINSRGNKELYETKDGWMMPLKGRAPWDDYAIFFDAMELIEEKYQTPQGQQIYAQEIQDVLSAKILERERYEVFHEGQQAGFVFGVAQSLDDVVACPQLEARDYFQQVAHPLAGTGRYTTTPFKFSDAPVPPYRPAPTLGQHNREVFQDVLGYSETDLLRLKELGVT